MPETFPILKVCAGSTLSEDATVVSSVSSLNSSLNDDIGLTPRLSDSVAFISTAVSTGLGRFTGSTTESCPVLEPGISAEVPAVLPPLLKTPVRAAIPNAADSTNTAAIMITTVLLRNNPPILLIPLNLTFHSVLPVISYKAWPAANYEDSAIAYTYIDEAASGFVSKIL